MPRLVIDTDMLLVFIMGSVDVRMLGAARRVKNYTQVDYDLIYTQLTLFDEVVLLPNTVTEASNLLDHLSGDWRQGCMVLLAALTQARPEIYIPSLQATQQPEYLALGVTDAAILCALEHGT